MAAGVGGAHADCTGVDCTGVDCTSIGGKARLDGDIANMTQKDASGPHHAGPIGNAARETSPPEAGSLPPDSLPTGPLDPGQVRLLKIAVVAMGLMILAGLAAVVGRVIYLASGGQKQAVTVSGPSGAPQGTAWGAGQRAPANARLALPPQSIVRHLALSGDRLAVQFDGPAGTGIAIIDVATGAVVSRIELVPEVPR